MAEPNETVEETSASYKKIIHTELGAEENSNEGIVQFGFNYEKPKRGQGQAYRTDISRWERANILNNHYIRRVMKQLKMFRKRKLLMAIVHDYLQNREFIRWFYSIGSSPFRVIEKRDQSEEVHILDYLSMPDNPASPLCTWFREFVRNLTNELVSTDLADQANQYDLIATYIKRPEYRSTNDLIVKVHTMAMQGYSSYRGSVDQWKDQEIYIQKPEFAFINLVNYLCIGYAHIHRISFAVLKNIPSNTNKFVEKELENKYFLKARNTHNTEYHKKTKGKLQLRHMNMQRVLINKVIYDNINRSPGHPNTPEGTPSDTQPMELPANLCFYLEDALFETSAGQAGRDFDEFEEEPEAEEGWADIAPGILTKAGLDPTAYGLPSLPSTSTAPPHTPTGDYELTSGNHGGNDVDNTPPSSSSSSGSNGTSSGSHSPIISQWEPPTPYTPTPSSEDDFVPATPTPKGSYEELVTEVHKTPIVDVADVADAGEAAIQKYIDEEESGELVEGGEFLVPPEAFTSVIVGLADPNTVTVYNTPPLSIIPETEEDEIVEYTDDEALAGPPTPPTPPLRFPTVSEVLMRDDREGLRGPVHRDPLTCSHTANAFIEAWRKAKLHAYKHKKFRHFPINRSFFATGAVCHRCYQLVRQHHEHYHRRGGALVDRAVWKYPRSRRDSSIAKIAAPSKTTRKYKKSRKAAKKMTKQYNKLLDKSPKEAKDFARAHSNRR